MSDYIRFAFIGAATFIASYLVARYYQTDYETPQEETPNDPEPTPVKTEKEERKDNGKREKKEKPHPEKREENKKNELASPVKPRKDDDADADTPPEEDDEEEEEEQYLTLPFHQTPPLVASPSTATSPFASTSSGSPPSSSSSTPSSSPVKKQAPPQESPSPPTFIIPHYRIVYRRMRTGEEKAVSDLVLAVFHKMLASEYTQEGVQNFLLYASPSAIAERALTHSVFIAEAIESKSRVVRTHPPRQDKRKKQQQPLNSPTLDSSLRRFVGAIEIRDHNHISLFFVLLRFQRQGIGRNLWELALRYDIIKHHRKQQRKALSSQQPARGSGSGSGSGGSGGSKSSSSPSPRGAAASSSSPSPFLPGSSSSSSAMSPSSSSPPSLLSIPQIHITVNASPYAVPVYKALGFSENGPTTTKDGLVFIPMYMNY